MRNRELRIAKLNSLRKAPYKKNENSSRFGKMNCIPAVEVTVAQLPDQSVSEIMLHIDFGTFFCYFLGRQKSKER